MSNELKAINDAEARFDLPPVKVESGKYACPVCAKEYVKEQTVHEHMEKRECINYHALFENTVSEVRGYKVYVALINEVNPMAKTSVMIFRKSGSYNSVMRYVSVMLYHGMSHLSDLYLAWIIENKGTKFINQTLKYACEPKNLDLFKVDVHTFDLIDENDQIDTVRKNIDNIKSDNLFFLRMIETCKLTIRFVLRVEELDAILDNFPTDYKIRLEELMQKVLEREQK